MSNPCREKEMWKWQGQDYCHEDDASIEISSCLANGMNEGEEHLSYMFDDATPLKACGDLAYHAPISEVSSKELELYEEPSSQGSQGKRRRMLQFESGVVDAPSYNHKSILRSKEARNSFEDPSSEMSDWVSGFAEDPNLYSNECLDQAWLTDCLNEDEMQFTPEEISSESGASDVQIDITEFCDPPIEYIPNPVKRQPVQTRRNVVFRGKKSFMSVPRKASSVIMPFDIVKPCGIHGHLTLRDINQKILNPLKPKAKEEDLSVSYPTSAFSGKPVVGKTRIPTQGGKGSVTIMRTRG